MPSVNGNDVNVNSKDGGVNYSNKTAVKGFVTGKVTVGSTGNNLLGDNDVVSGVRIIADAANQETVFIGNSSGVSASNGYPLSANAEVFIDIDNTNKIFHTSVGGGETLNYIAS
tara:strand:+ start:1327 stop:1668 length:342 start_codon:yes stop_codon:yes gene_type:complete